MVTLHANSNIDTSTLPIWLDWELNPFIWIFALTALFLYARGMARSQGTGGNHFAITLDHSR
jgi:hypothetical protein